MLNKTDTGMNLDVTANKCIKSTDLSVPIQRVGSLLREWTA